MSTSAVLLYGRPLKIEWLEAVTRAAVQKKADCLTPLWSIWKREFSSVASRVRTGCGSLAPFGRQVLRIQLSAFCGNSAFRVSSSSTALNVCAAFKARACCTAGRSDIAAMKRWTAGKSSKPLSPNI